MQLAIDKARAGIAAGQTPFGCAIARGDVVLAVCHNTVWTSTDITAHAEINALRQACRTSGRVLLEDCQVATTCEPCPMCMSALHWARVQVVYYGAQIADASAAGFNELSLAAADLLRQGASPVRLVGGVSAEACQALFPLWQRQSGSRAY